MPQYNPRKIKEFEFQIDKVVTKTLQEKHTGEGKVNQRKPKLGVTRPANELSIMSIGDIPPETHYLGWASIAKRLNVTEVTARKWARLFPFLCYRQKGLRNRYQVISNETRVLEFYYWLSTAKPIAKRTAPVHE